MKKNRIKIKKKNKKNYFYVGIAISIIAAILILINALLGLIIRPNLSNYLSNSPEFVSALNKYGNNLIKELNSILLFLSIFWFFLIFLIIISLIAIYQNEKNWFYFLFLALLALFSFRIESSILLFISTILFYIYKKNNQK